MKETVLYIKAEKDTVVTNTKVFLQDVVTMYSTDKDLVKELGQQVFMVVSKKKREKFVFSVLKLVDMITKEHPGVVVQNLGETDFIVEYMPPGKEHRIWEWVKTILVCISVFLGSAFTIMTFNEDVSVQEVFQKFYLLVTGREHTGYGVLEIAYAVGLPLGIIVFYNHFTKLKIDSDPTPLQVQLRVYEQDVNDAIIENASREGKERDA